ncbi:hypothetical protein [Tahibacter caeni]|uniref:hypothetical protein n=1 Tax=Tahibacter caeni TaxID=1453545 RepID=UPI002147E8E7|nr:hypothetical protein [Tahibacter caeni]
MDAPGVGAPAHLQPTHITHPIEPTKKQKPARKPRAAVVVPVAPDWLDPNAWAEWVDYRSKLKGFTARALELSLKTIGRHRQSGHDPVRLIELAIERGWTGIYPSDATLADGQQLGSATGRALVALQRLKGTGNVTQDFEAAWAQQPRLPAGMLPRDPRSEEEQLEAMIAGSLDPEATRALLHAESTEESQA